MPAVKQGFTLEDTLRFARQLELDIEIYLTEAAVQNLDHDRLNRLNLKDFCEYFERLLAELPAERLIEIVWERGWTCPDYIGIPKLSLAKLSRKRLHELIRLSIENPGLFAAEALKIIKEGWR